MSKRSPSLHGWSLLQKRRNRSRSNSALYSAILINSMSLILLMRGQCRIQQQPTAIRNTRAATITRGQVWASSLRPRTLLTRKQDTSKSRRSSAGNGDKFGTQRFDDQLAAKSYSRELNVKPLSSK